MLVIIQNHIILMGISLPVMMMSGDGVFLDVMAIWIKKMKKWIGTKHKP